MNTTQNLKVVESRPINARSRMEATTPNGAVTIVYDNSPQQLLRIALGLKAISITITTLIH